MSDEATREGVSEETETAKPDTRFNRVEDMADRFQQQQEEELNEALESDPGLKAQHDAMEAEATPEDEGLATKERIEDDDLDPSPDSDEPETEDEPDTDTGDDDDPLKDFIVYQDGEPMVSLKVDGETRLLPLQKAQAELQKRESGDARLQRANEMNQDLERRAAAIAQTERELEARAKTPPSGKADVDDDEALKTQATRLVKTLFTGTEEEAAEAVTAVLSSRASSQTPIDVDDIAEQAAERAEQRRAERERQAAAEARKKDEVKGFEKFQTEYKDIVADPHLFAVADGLTGEIERENPDWTPTEVMMEAGKRTREWWNGTPERKAEIQKREDDLDKRQKRKQQLRPMPRRASVTPEKEPEERPETPADIVAQMRAQRSPIKG